MTIRTSSSKSRVCFVVLLVVLLLENFQSALLYGQVAGATLSGVITDQSGRSVPSAAVSIKNVTTGVTREATPDANGFYTAPNLLPGSYQVTTSSAGFRTVVQKGITLTVGATLTLNVTMVVGRVTETIEVTDVAPNVDVSSSTVSGNVDAATVRELPLNGRDWTTLATLQPGVDTVPVQQPNQGTAPKGNRGYGNQMTISGTRPQQNNYRLDGISINDYSNGAPGSVAGLNLGVDAVAEFSVLTSNYSAEYGRTSGGVINAVTRSGTNHIHGSAFEFLRNSALDARNFFDGSKVPPFRRNQFGGSVGGPIRKDRTFIFGSYEGLRQSLTGTAPTSILSATARQGQLCNAPDCSTYTTYDLVTNGIGKYLPFWPTPKPSDTVVCPFSSCVAGHGDTALESVQTASIAREDFWTARFDHRISEKDSLFGTYMFDDATTHSPDPLNTWLVGNLSRRQAVILEENHIFSPTVANSLRLGFSRVSAIVNSTINGINPAASDKTLGIYSTSPQYAPQINVSGIQGGGGGLGSDPTYHYHWNSYQVYDDAFWTRGLHSLKFGFALERMQDNVLADLQPTGLFGFGSLLSFFQNAPTTAIATVPGALTGRGIRQTLLGGYIQDDWRLRPRLTVNLGLRYEMTTVPTEVRGKLSNVRTMTSPTISAGSPYFQNPTLKNFEPRVGLAWDPFGNGKTSVRAAFGFFDVVPLPAAFSLAIDQSAPFYKFFTVSPPAGCNPFPTCVGDANKQGNGQTTLQTAFIQYHPPRNYVMIWSLNLQRELSKNTSVMAGYVGNHGVHMLNREDDINSVLPTQTPQGLLMPLGAVPACTEAALSLANGGGGCKVNPANGDIRGIYWTGDAFYDSLEAEVKTRIGRGLNLQGSYTWGKAIDTGSATVIGDPFQTSISSPYFFCKKCRRGLSDFDIRHSFSAHFIWDVPSPKSLGFAGSEILGGWELGTIVTAQSGVPFTPTIAGDVLGLGSADPWAFPSLLPGCNPINSNFKKNGTVYFNSNCFTFPLQGTVPNSQCNQIIFPQPTSPPACLNLFGNLRRNSLVGPKLVSVDLSLYKNFYLKKISETFNIQFRTEFFNIFNHANFAPPINNIAVLQSNVVGGINVGSNVSSAGLIDRTTNTSRQIQFGLKVIW
jgi:outer membrane receptor protein involved in Fe transport